MSVKELLNRTIKDIPIIIRRDFKDIRKVRQQNNDDAVYKSIITGDIKEFKANINEEAFKRLLDKLGISKEDIFFAECRKNNLLCISSSMYISKLSSRQGGRDEMQQILTCDMTAQKCGIKIEKLSVVDIRPTKDGHIINSKEMKAMCINKDECLKSFDAKISGLINGYVAAKVVFTSGGHQDNVLEEMDTLAEWWRTWKNDNDQILVILIDTDLYTSFNRLQTKHKDVQNVKVFDHIQFQEYMISIRFLTDVNK